MEGSLEQLSLMEGEYIKSYPKINFGQLSSLYASLSSEAVSLLQTACYLYRVRAFKEAMAIFESFQEPIRFNPIVVAEHFAALMADWRMKDAAFIIEEALLYAARVESNHHQQATYMLLRALRARVTFFTEGTFYNAKDSMREIRGWLQRVQIEEYTELQVRCLQEYARLVVFAKQNAPEFGPLQYASVPHVSCQHSSDHGLWPGLSVLREHLQKHGRLSEAFSLLEIELSVYTDPSARESRIQSFLASCDNPIAGQPVWWLHAKVKLRHSEFLASFHRLDEAKREVASARDLLHLGTSDHGEKGWEFEIDVATLKLKEDEDLNIRLNKWMSLADSAAVDKDKFMESTALQESVDIAAELCTQQQSISSRQTFDSLASRSQALLKYLGDKYFVLIGRLTVDSEVMSRGDLGSILQWHENFEKDHPVCHYWQILIATKQRNIMIYTTLQDHNKAFQTLATVNKLISERDMFWVEAEKVCIQGEESGISGSIHTSGAIGEPSDSEDDEFWGSEWSNEVLVGHPQLPSHELLTVELGKNKLGQRLSHWATLLRWMRKDLTYDLLGPAAAGTILLAGETSATKQKLLATLDDLDPTGLLHAVVGDPANPVLVDQWTHTLKSLSAWLMDAEHHNLAKRHYLLSEMQVIRLQSIAFASPSQEANHVLEFERLEDLVSRLCPEIRKNRAGGICIFRDSAAIAKISLGCQPPAYLIKSIDYILEIAAMFDKTLKEEHEIGMLREEAHTRVLIAGLCHTAIRVGLSIDFEETLDHLRAGEILNLRFRDSFRSFHGWEAVQKVRLSAEESYADSLFPLAISIILLMPDPEKRHRSIWTWVQKAKAQGLARLMSYDLAIEAAKWEVEQDGDDLGSQLRNAEEHATKSDLRHLENLATSSKTNVVFVDWYSHPTSGYLKDLIVAIIFRPGFNLESIVLDITLPEVTRLAEKLFQGDEQELKHPDIYCEFQKLAPLIHPLRKYSMPGDTLVLIPSGIMHSIPLHALKLDDETLICRNPIVYSSSITILLHAFHTRNTHENHLEQNLYQLHTSVFGEPSLTAGKSAIHSVAAKFGVDPHMDDGTFTSTAFAADIRNSSLFHYHGHALFQEDRPLDHFLDFADKEMTMRDIFDLGPPPHGESSTSFHATLLGCGSGMARVSSTNEIFGLVPAFQYIGAASVVSTLWKVDDMDAALWSDAFYEAFGTEDGIIDLAKAAQKASLRVMRERGALYHWAPFVLNGWWIMKALGLRGINT